MLPFTSSFQGELNRRGVVCLNNVRVVVLECLSKDDPIFRISEQGWKHASRIINGHKNSSFQYKLTETKSELLANLSARDYDIVVISAHGTYNRDANSTGIVVGNEIFRGNEIDFFAPLVILSCCSASPRADGAINVGDLLLRSGAISVLSTMIPVDVRENSVLMVRYFVYIIESILGNEPHLTILDAWHRTVAGNAFNDILNSSEWLREFRMMKVNQMSVVEYFMTVKSKNRVTLANVYEDSIAVLSDIAGEIGPKTKAKFDAVIANQGVVPHSIFYQFLGYPESVYLRESFLLSKAVDTA